MSTNGTDSPSRLSNRLSPAPLATIRTKYPSQHYVVTRLLGCEPLSGCYADLHPPTMRVRDALVPAFFHVPYTDFGLGNGSIEPKLRSAILFLASQAMGCAYCQAHCMGIGCMLRGGGVYLDFSVSASVAPEASTPAEQACFAMAKAVGSVPCAMTVEHRLAMAKTMAASHIEPAILMAVMMGWLTRFMDTLGMPLEYEAYTNAQVHQHTLGWQAGKHVQTSDKERERLDEESQTKWTNPHGVLDKITLFRHVIACKVADVQGKRGLPTDSTSLEVTFVEKWGFLPYYLERLASADARSALVLALLRGLTLEHGKISQPMRWLVCYVHAVHAQNAILQAHFAFLAVHSGVVPTDLVDIRLGSTQQQQQHVKLALQFAVQCSGSAPCSLDEATMTDLTKEFTDSEIVVLVETMATFGLLRALTGAFPPTKYEPAIAEFVTNLPDNAVDTIVDFEDWDAVVEAEVMRKRSAESAN